MDAYLPKPSMPPSALNCPPGGDLVVRHLCPGGLDAMLDQMYRDTALKGGRRDLPRRVQRRSQVARHWRLHCRPGVLRPTLSSTARGLPAGEEGAREYRACRGFDWRPAAENQRSRILGVGRDRLFPISLRHLSLPRRRRRTVRVRDVVCTRFDKYSTRTRIASVLGWITPGYFSGPGQGIRTTTLPSAGAR